MVHRALLVSNLLAIFFVSCSPAAGDAVLLNADSLALENRNGIMYLGNVPFTGAVYTLYNSTDTLLRAAYLNGKERGEWKRFYPDGHPEELRYFYEGRKINTLQRWWPNGQLQLQCTFNNGEYEGILREWDAYGQLTREMNYHEGYEAGPQKMYYPNGKIRSNYVVKDGRRIGLLGTKNCVNVSDSIFQ